MDWVAENQKNPNIVQIKICIAASSAFIFALGMKFSKTQNKENVIFHYEKDTYPWGVNVHKGKPACFCQFPFIVCAFLFNMSVLYNHLSDFGEKICKSGILSILSRKTFDIIYHRNNSILC